MARNDNAIPMEMRPDGLGYAARLERRQQKEMDRDIDRKMLGISGVGDMGQDQDPIMDEYLSLEDGNQARGFFSKYMAFSPFHDAEVGMSVDANVQAAQLGATLFGRKGKVSGSITRDRDVRFGMSGTSIEGSLNLGKNTRLSGVVAPGEKFAQLRISKRF